MLTYITLIMADDLVLPNLQESLIKDGWTLRAKAPTIRTKGKYYLTDVAAEKEGQKIIVEVKSWLSTSFNPDWFGAFGQYLTYQEVILAERLNYKLYLAVPENIYNQHFINPFIQSMVTKYSMNLLIFDLNTNTVAAWK